jgi:hypothetical protein
MGGLNVLKKDLAKREAQFHSHPQRQTRSRSKNTQHPYASALFSDWTLSDESQKYIADEFRGPLIGEHPYLPDDIKVVTFGYVSDEIVDRLHNYWNQHIGKKNKAAPRSSDGHGRRLLRRGGGGFRWALRNATGTRVAFVAGQENCNQCVFHQALTALAS